MRSDQKPRSFWVKMPLVQVDAAHKDINRNVEAEVGNPLGGLAYGLFDEDPHGQTIDESARGRRATLEVSPKPAENGRGRLSGTGWHGHQVREFFRRANRSWYG